VEEYDQGLNQWMTSRKGEGRVRGMTRNWDENWSRTEVGDGTSGERECNGCRIVQRGDCWEGVERKADRRKEGPA
jgi:hypothetical protein